MKEGDFERIDRISSPAHVGKLKHSIDFLCNEGDPIRASLEGQVISVKDDSNVGGNDKKYWDDGNRIEIIHTNGEYSAYEHLRYKGSKVRVGEQIETGQLVGHAGSTGYTFIFGPHLHFEVFRLVGQGEEDYETLEVKFEDYKE